MAKQEMFNVLKVDIDLKPPDLWLQNWMDTRDVILSYFGLEMKKIRYRPTEHGWHFWIHLDHEVDYDMMIMLQFILGDDTNRCYFGLQRQGFKRFRGKFNMLFSKKRRLK